MVERERHGRHRNLVVAATGTGQDRRGGAGLPAASRQARPDLSLLFVAHRERILEQSRATFRAVLRDGSFGEIHGGGRVAAGAHVFAMIQSVSEETSTARARRTSTSSSSTSSITPRRRAIDACSTVSTARTAGTDGHAGTHGRAGRHRVLWRADRRRAAPVGGDRRGLPRAVPVLRRRRRNRSLEPAMATRRLCARRPRPRHHGDTPRVAKLLEAIQRVVAEPSARCARSASASQSSTPNSWRARSRPPVSRPGAVRPDAEPEPAAALRALEVGELARRLLGRRARRRRRRAERRHGAAAAPD